SHSGARRRREPVTHNDRSDRSSLSASGSAVDMDTGRAADAARRNGASAPPRLAVDLVVVAVLVPAVNGPAAPRDVALLVIRDRAEHSIPAAAADGGGDLLRVSGAGLGGGLRPYLKGGVCVEHVAFGIDALVLELLHDRGSRGTLARIRWEGDQHAFAG